MFHRLPALLCSIVAAALTATGCQEPSPQVVVVARPAPPPPTSQPAAQTAVTVTRDPAAQSSVEIAERADTLTGTNLRLADLLSVAFRTPEGPHGRIPLLSTHRVTSATPLPADRYDVRIYVPGGDAARLKAALRKTLQDSFGLTARCELRAVTALVLRAPSGGLRPAPVEATPPTDVPPATRRTVLTGDNLSLLAEQLEELLGQPVINETSLQGSYALRLDQSVTDGSVKPLALDAARTALREQLGLDLLQGPRDVEYLIVREYDRAQRP